MDYFTLKWIHILSSTILFGTGLGSAFWMFMANRSRDLMAMRFATRIVVLADWIFTTPSIIIQPVTGLWMAHVAGLGLDTKWIFWGMLLYGFAGACWLPVVWIQIRMKAMVEAAINDNVPLPPQYWVFDRWWIILGSLAFPAVVAIFWLMVCKP